MTETQRIHNQLEHAPQLFSKRLNFIFVTFPRATLPHPK